MTWKEIKNIINNMDGSELESEAKFLKNGNTLVTISLEKTAEEHYTNSEWGQYTVPKSDMSVDDIQDENALFCIKEGLCYFWEEFEE